MEYRMQNEIQISTGNKTLVCTLRNFAILKNNFDRNWVSECIGAMRWRLLFAHFQFSQFCVYRSTNGIQMRPIFKLLINFRTKSFAVRIRRVSVSVQYSGYSVEVIVAVNRCDGMLLNRIYFCLEKSLYEAIQFIFNSHCFDVGDRRFDCECFVTDDNSVKPLTHRAQNFWFN